jgi:hypothetical protein
VQQDVLFGGPTEPPEFDDRAETRLRVLVTVKAAPNPSATYGETVCVAGLRLDLGSEGWIRLYPINFRFIEGEHTFRKYDIITLVAAPSTEGRRESWRPRPDTITVEGTLDGWPKRLPHLLPFADTTMCSLNERSLKGGPSLGLVRAREVLGLDIEDHPGWSEDEQQTINDYVNQPELFDAGKPKTALEAPLFKAFYRWKCLDNACKGHRQGLLDWEFTAFQRRLHMSADRAREAIRHKWLDEVCGPSKDVYFFVGNQAKRPHVFSVLGVVWPNH